MEIKEMRNSIILLLLLIPYSILSQTVWKSVKHNYTIEIPEGFSRTQSIGANVDFKANKGESSIVIVVISIPLEYARYTIWDLFGDLETYGTEWEEGAQEFMNNPKFIKYGKTSLSNLETFWYDYTTDDPKLYSKTYQTVKNGKLYTITLTCLYSEYNTYSPVWFRFKDKMKID